MSTTETERRIAAAFAARAEEITMSPTTLQERLAEVQDRGAAGRTRRRRVQVGAAVLAAAAAATAVAVGIGGVSIRDEAAPYAGPDRVQLADPYVRGEVFPDVGTTYSVEDSPVSFTFSVPELGGVPGEWRANTDGQFSVGLDASEVTDHATMTVEVVDQAYDPTRPWTEQDALVDAPQTADAWEQWLEDSGLATVTGREEIEVGGVPAERVSFETAAEMPDSYRGCFPGTPCLAVRPIGPGVVGSGFQAGFAPGWAGEITVLEIDGTTVVLTATGAADAQDQWLPLMHSVVESLRFA